MGRPFEPVPFSEESDDDTGDKQQSSQVDAVAIKPQQQVHSTTETSHDRVVRSILYDYLLPKVSIGMACNVHNLIQSGEYSITSLKQPSSRQELYPNIYEGKSEQEMNQELKHYATDFPTTTSSSKKRSFSEVSSKDTSSNSTMTGESTTAAVSKVENPTGASNTTALGTEPPAPTTTTTITTTSQRQPNCDIWGRIPPKEPKNACLCQVCGRSVSATRFAQHLDKCLQLGNTRPASSGRAASFAS
jgi:hypothetical protein